MKPGEEIQITVRVLRVEGSRLDAQTRNGELIQTHVDNVEHKAILNAPEDKSGNRQKNRNK